MSANRNRGGSPRFSISQNFLTSAGTISRLLRLTSISKDDHVIEIGAGKGHITRRLAHMCRRLDAYEIDPGLWPALLALREAAPNLTVKRQDFLTAALPPGGEYKVFGNIPFSRTSDIIKKLTNAKNPPIEAWLLMEHGAAKRFAGAPQARRDTLGSLLIKPFFDSRIVCRVPRFEFHPAPSVDAALLHLVKKTPPDIQATQKREFERFIERGMRYGAESQLTKRQIGAALRLAGLPDTRQSALMRYVQWLCLFRYYLALRGSDKPSK
ncbi:MAG: rRNA adenine N(6)-methyltransferase family protein [Oscillospiraceae bacterium]|nr:rRNA adenine N(6)-methyltransferase family protein [Oscillospiraceae bacterium]